LLRHLCSKSAWIRTYRLTSLDLGIDTREEKGHTLPTYQYACTACDHAFEAFQSFSDAAITECPECKGEVRKVYSNVGVVFKGSGFYKTDSVAKPAASSD
jgi:putative FmdB family regulatory protein